VRDLEISLCGLCAFAGDIPSFGSGFAALDSYDVFTTDDLYFTVHRCGLMLCVRRNERCLSGSKDTFFVAYADAKLSGEHIDHLLLWVLVRLGAGSSSEAVTPDFDLPAFDRGSFGGGVLRADNAPVHFSPVIKWHGRSFS
jgi:hypothetical protein